MITRVNSGGDVNVEDDDYKMVGTVTVVARQDEDFGAIARSQYWPVEQPDPKQWVWTDDYSNAIGSVIRKYYPK
jgi:hypothetical protein